MACPICNRDSVATYRPFCSRRCADVDLGRWLRGAYVIPGQSLDDLTLDEGSEEKNRVGGLDSGDKRP